MTVQRREEQGRQLSCSFTTLTLMKRTYQNGSVACGRKQVGRVAGEGDGAAELSATTEGCGCGCELDRMEAGGSVPVRVEVG